jgi:hypothetical protein
MIDGQHRRAGRLRIDTRAGRYDFVYGVEGGRSNRRGAAVAGLR